MPGPITDSICAMTDTPEEATEDEQPKSASRVPVRVADNTWSRWTAPVASLLAVVAVGLAIWALTKSPSTPAETKLAGDPKLRVCSAFDLVTKAVSLQTHANLGPDPIAQSAVAANARLALVGGGQYLLNSLDSATDPKLADAVRSFANDLLEVGMNAAAGATNTDTGQSERLTRADSTRKQIAELCK
jgi:hypothetical protein